MDYKSLPREENAIFEEKLDGSNFSWRVENRVIRTFSRNKEIKLGDSDFWDRFILFINVTNRYVHFEEGITWYAEALGKGNIKYFKDYEDTLTFNILYVFDIKGKAGNFYDREYVETLCKQHYVNIVPLADINSDRSTIGDKPLREGMILRWEKASGMDGKAFKAKYVERKRKHKQKIKIEEIK